MIDLYLAVCGELVYHYGTFFVKRWKDPTTPYEWDYFLIMILAMTVTYAVFLQGLLCGAFTDLAFIFASNKAGRIILRVCKFIL